MCMSLMWFGNVLYDICFFFSSRRRHTRFDCDWSSDVCSSDLQSGGAQGGQFWAQDLRSAIAARYSVGLSAASWGVLAAGPNASCALQFALADSTRYSAAAAINPAPNSSSPSPSAANPSSAAFNPSSWLATYPAPPSRILLAGVSGSPDGVL